MTPRRSGAVRPAVRRLSFRWTGPFLLSLLGLYAVLALETLARARRLCHRADTAWAEALDPPLTVVRQPAYEVGRAAAEMLLKRLGDRSLPAAWLRLRPRLIVRNSC